MTNKSAIQQLKENIEKYGEHKLFDQSNWHSQCILELDARLTTLQTQMQALQQRFEHVKTTPPLTDWKASWIEMLQNSSGTETNHDVILFNAVLKLIDQVQELQQPDVHFYDYEIKCMSCDFNQQVSKEQYDKGICPNCAATTPSAPPADFAYAVSLLQELLNPDKTNQTRSGREMLREVIAILQRNNNK